MTHRFYIEGAIPKEGVFILNSEAVAHQLSRVLKIHEGEEVIFFNGAGIDHVTAIVKISRRFVSGRVKACLRSERDPSREVHLFHALTKKDTIEWMLEKGTELGVKFFHPVRSERSVKTGINRERARRIVIEATEQSGQGMVPVIADVVAFTDVLEHISSGAHTFLFDPTGTALVPEKVSLGAVNILIGPEGGFTPQELLRARECGIPITSLGKRILRAETAAIIAVAKLLDGC
ncbi:MAG: hypothetical protein A3I44_03180 [Candidatus Sungbacteria bacterium RIFCSPLOWO2_02_FULL_51_17]|uniref:Ribosomal RNA small subunit methyltransferase E n=1 Tax=Candidatus Sungbacteria bacterium RIFCSPHIGHO2_02_FULL_51_29 TaxID=1802273 RepID=A0A1G2KQJ8_9BACT|nr:MAG: hypothetical protein A2676_02120 [Candidatus Sungbacteria bacterium RIFCSPHIGHO2_01_FULL_51_22]OHA01700.1 MAG: hypothetical protein A3C16_03125 [Candidatus Sungbacteria bacterium RIFCSPHIGHO2_02_FULL_51_29]OHA08008.1 MAG: hypothetical protein A3B29_03570 [Candidatus Sungbacteria bacterium RIFCSPLOWO2_01_FULL_51_34]OHA10987.1 MAG: hypothetical protein A3I44_03180 [Candidatus Sungbacteria bacterium RIFCSPLOWO2_02_FULL_51_17]